MAKTTGALKHTHKYFRRDDGRWACSGIGGCTHYMPSNMAPLPAGLNSFCWSCEKEFQLAPYNMKETRPRCDDCMERLDAINRFLDEKMAGIETDPVIRVVQQARIRSQQNYAEITKPKPVKDEIEVINPTEEHAPECSVHNGGDCDCT